jgi:bifunctional non-homologous end joining protein LigD
VVIGGWTEGKGERQNSLGALLLGLPGPDGLEFVGKVGTGFSERDRQAILGTLHPLRTRSSPFAEPIPAADAKVAHYVRAELVGEVGYGEWTTGGRLRHPKWRGLRADKSPDEVSRETEADTGPDTAVTAVPEGPGAAATGLQKRRQASTAASAPTRVRVGDHEVQITNLEKVLFPQTGFTKGQLIDYYARIAPVMLPQVVGRPLTMKRYPDGVEGKFFFEKRIPSHAPRWVKTATVRSERQGSITYPVVDDLPSLVWAANLGTIEFHVPLWRAAARRSLPANPDLMVFDLDPGEGASIVECCEVAMLLVESLSGRGTDVYAKTSGMKGLQLYYPVGPRTGWEAVREEAHGVARQLESEHRDLVVSTMRKDLRRGRVLIDWSQNHPAKTTIAVYSVRAAPTPTVSTPVALSEVRRCAHQGAPGVLRFDTDAVLARVAKEGDLFAGLGAATD